MKKQVFALWLFSPLFLFGQTPMPFNQTPTIEAAKQIVSSLDAVQKPLMLLSFADKDRLEWSNLPLEQVWRRGLRMDSLTEAQRQLVHNLLRTVLSQQGYQKILLIMHYDDGIRERQIKAQNPLSRRYGQEKYWLTIFGNPSATEAWGWQFEGHHVSLNLTLTPRGVTCTPMFTGINPALTTEGVSAGQYVMADENELGKQLFNSLSPPLRKQALLGELPKDVDVLTRTGKESHVLKNEGVAYNDLTAEQKVVVLKIIKSWVGNLHEDLAAEKMQRLIKSLPQLRFAWLGDDDTAHLHYYRLQTPSFIIEMSNRDGGIYHLHTLWRDFEEDFKEK